MPAVAKKVNGVVMTSSPAFNSSALSGSSSASVPLAHPMPCLARDELLRFDDAREGGHDFTLDGGILRHEVEEGDVHGLRGGVVWRRAPACSS